MFFLPSPALRGEDLDIEDTPAAVAGFSIFFVGDAVEGDAFLPSPCVFVARLLGSGEGAAGWLSHATAVENSDCGMLYMLPATSE